MDKHSAPDMWRHQPHGSHTPAAPRPGVAEPPDQWGPLLEQPLVDMLRAAWAAGFAEGRRTRDQ